MGLDSPIFFTHPHPNPPLEGEGGTLRCSYRFLPLQGGGQEGDGSGLTDIFHPSPPRPLQGREKRSAAVNASSPFKGEEMSRSILSRAF
jgi:hypothetical protein